MHSYGLILQLIQGHLGLVLDNSWAISDLIPPEAVSPRSHVEGTDCVTDPREGSKLEHLIHTTSLTHLRVIKRVMVSSGFAERLRPFVVLEKTWGILFASGRNVSGIFWRWGDVCRWDEKMGINRSQIQETTRGQSPS